MPRDGSMAPQADSSTLLRLWRTWRRHAREQRLAAQFTDRDLRDLGLTRGDLQRALDGRGWWRMIFWGPTSSETRHAANL
jgi:uncharacterized protein YjiS (DUF1127 family)